MISRCVITEANKGWVGSEKPGRSASRKAGPVLDRRHKQLVMAIVFSSKKDFGDLGKNMKRCYGDKIRITMTGK